MENVLKIQNNAEFREWLEKHSAEETECWVVLRRGKPKDDGNFYYLDAVEAALSFGWIDSTQKIVDGVHYQRFSPRKKNSPWSELNKERVRRLEKLGLMTESGRAVLPLNAFVYQKMGSVAQSYRARGKTCRDQPSTAVRAARAPS